MLLTWYGVLRLGLTRRPALYLRSWSDPPSSIIVTTTSPCALRRSGVNFSDQNVTSHEPRAKVRLESCRLVLPLSTFTFSVLQKKVMPITLLSTSHRHTPQQSLQRHPYRSPIWVHHYGSHLTHLKTSTTSRYHAFLRDASSWASKWDLRLPSHSSWGDYTFPNNLLAGRNLAWGSSASQTDYVLLE